MTLRNQSEHISGCFTCVFHLMIGAARKYHLVKMDLSREGYAIPMGGIISLSPLAIMPLPDQAKTVRIISR